MPAAGPNPLASLIPVGLIFAIFYFLLIRPQQKQQKEHEQMLAALKKGDRVLTTGGLYGTITAVKGSDIEIRVAENLKLLVARSCVTRLAPENETAPIPVAA